jgi:hypothetical protein
MLALFLTTFCCLSSVAVHQILTALGLFCTLKGQFTPENTPAVRIVYIAQKAVSKQGQRNTHSDDKHNDGYAPWAPFPSFSDSFARISPSFLPPLLIQASPRFLPNQILLQQALSHRDAENGETRWQNSVSFV